MRLYFPREYPETICKLEGTEKTGGNTRKGFGSYVLEVARSILERIFAPGSVCLFDLLEELETFLAEKSLGSKPPPRGENTGDQDNDIITDHRFDTGSDRDPQWITSTPIEEKKSLFLARACSVTSLAQAKAYLDHLVATDKHTAKATHNITAYRIRSPPTASISSESVYQDCDDDGETAAGRRLLHLLQVMGVWDVLVVVSRWYGGVKLGSDRFRIINTVAREAVVAGGWVKEVKN